MATLGEFLGSGASTTKLLLHLNGSSADSSGNGNNGTDTGIDYVDGKFGKCASFNATTDKIVCGDTPFDFERTQAFTVSVWTKINATNTTAIIIGKQVASGAFNGWSLYRLYLSAPDRNYLEFGLINNGATNGLIIDTTANPTIPDTTGWHNIIATYDGSSTAAGAKIYVNGVQMATSTTSDTLSASILNNVQLEVGNRNGALNYNGYIDEVIYDLKVWTPAEVKKYYSASKGRWATL